MASIYHCFDLVLVTERKMIDISSKFDTM